MVCILVVRYIELKEKNIVFPTNSLQNADGRTGEASGRAKVSEQSMLQHAKAKRNPEETRKQRVII